MPLPLTPDEFAQALFALPDRAIYGVDRDGLCTFANPRCLDLLGARSTDDLVGRPMHALVHHTDGEGRPTAASSCPIHAAADHGPVIRRRDRLWRFDGRSFPVECWSLPLGRDGERLGRIVAFVNLADRPTGDDDAVSDETHLRMAAEANAERAAALAEVARFPEMNPGPVVRANAAGDVLLANTAARRVFGDGLIGVAWRALCPGIDDDVWRGILTSAEPVAIEAHIGECDYVFSHRCDPATELVFVFGSDVTRQKQAEHALRQSEKMATLGTLAAGVAHELNNPAAAASRAAEQLRTAFARLEQAHLDLEGLGLEADVRDRLRDLDRRAHERASARSPLSALERSDREAAVEEWLDDHLTDASTWRRRW